MKFFFFNFKFFFCFFTGLQKGLDCVQKASAKTKIDSSQFLGNLTPSNWLTNWFRGEARRRNTISLLLQHKEIQIILRLFLLSHRYVLSSQFKPLFFNHSTSDIASWLERKSLGSNSLETTFILFELPYYSTLEN